MRKYGVENINDHFISFNTICDATQVILSSILMILLVQLFIRVLRKSWAFDGLTWLTFFLLFMELKFKWCFSYPLLHL